MSKPIISEKLEKVIRNALPKEKVHRVKSVTKKENIQIPEIEGMDMEYAKMHFPDSGELWSFFAEFVKTSEVQVGQLNEAYAQLPVSIDEYKITVHGMKSVAATIGEIQLAGIAKTLEDAAKEEEVKIIKNLHPFFVREWKNFTLRLKKAVMPQQKERTKSSIDPQMKIGLLSIICSAMEVMDTDQAESAIQELLKYEYDSEESVEMKQLEGAIVNLDDDKAVAVAQKIIRRAVK